MNEIFFRVNANEAIGYGHFMRCFSLARFVSDRYSPTFIMNSAPNWIQNELRLQGIRLISLPEIPQFHPDDERSNSVIKFELPETLDLDGKIVVVDGYRFGPEYHIILNKLGAITINISDSLELVEFAQAIITPLILDDRALLSKQLNSVPIFSGNDGFLIRPEFYSSHPSSSKTRKFDYFIYVGQKTTLQYYCEDARLKHANVIALTNVSLADICRHEGWNTIIRPDVCETIRIMNDSEHAIVPASTIALEYAITTNRKPEVFALARNQEYGFNQFTAYGLWGNDEKSSRGQAIPIRFRKNLAEIKESLMAWLDSIRT